MTVTTSLKLSDELKARVTEMAAHEGKSAHAYMVDTLAEATRIKEERARFVEEALAAKRRFEKTGEAYDASDVFAHLRAKGAGAPVKKPRLRQWLK
jgi:predicted transcriptional regulator